VLSFIAWLAGITDCRELRLYVRQELRDIRHDVRAVLVAHLAIEVDQQRVVPSLRQRPRRAHVREHKINLRRFYRFALRGIRLRTFADARRVLDNLEAYVARCAVNYLEGMARRRARSRPSASGTLLCSWGPVVLVGPASDTPAVRRAWPLFPCGPHPAIGARGPSSETCMPSRESRRLWRPWRYRVVARTKAAVSASVAARLRKGRDRASTISR
jgi:hypothetical protein